MGGKKPRCAYRFLRDKGLYLLLKVQKGAVAQHFAGTGDRGVADAQDAGQFTGGHIAYGEKIVQEYSATKASFAVRGVDLTAGKRRREAPCLKIPSFFAVSLVRPMIT